MHLIQGLASGVVGAANGSATLVQRGTTTPAIYYTDFEASQAIRSTLSGIPLDANGSLVAYVNELVDVKVLDANGAQLCEFVAGDNASAVEVISRSFTGTDYVSGATGTSLPTTLQPILDLWITSAGSPDFNVSVNGAAMSLASAVAGLSGLFFNVKSYGAIGDGVADDGAAIQAANDAASATLNVGGIVFFPPGIYRSTTSINVNPGISWMGSGGTSTRVVINNPALAGLVLFNGVDSGSRLVQGIWFGALSDFAPPLVVVGNGGSASCVDFVGCIFGGDNFTKGLHLRVSGNGQGSRVTATRCTFYQGVDASILLQTGTGRIVCDDCDFIVTATGAYSSQVVNVLDGVTIQNCRFDAAAVTTGTVSYIEYAPATWDGCVFTGNRFRPNGSVTPIALVNASASNVDCYEAGNYFGDTTGQVIPYSGSLGFYAATSSLKQAFHGSRSGTIQVIASNAAAITATADFCGMTIVRRTGAGAQTITPSAGRIGDRWVLQVVNASGGNLTITAGAGMVLDNLVGTFVTSTAQSHLIEFVYSYTIGVTAAAWVQLSKGTDCG